MVGDEGFVQVVGMKKRKFEEDSSRRGNSGSIRWGWRNPSRHAGGGSCTISSSCSYAAGGADYRYAWLSARHYLTNLAPILLYGRFLLTWQHTQERKHSRRDNACSSFVRDNSLMLWWLTPANDRDHLQKSRPRQNNTLSLSTTAYMNILQKRGILEESWKKL